MVYLWKRGLVLLVLKNNFILYVLSQQPPGALVSAEMWNVISVNSNNNEGNSYRLTIQLSLWLGQLVSGCQWHSRAAVPGNCPMHIDQIHPVILNSDLLCFSLITKL